jgi:arylsulfatase A-like enzyme
VGRKAVEFIQGAGQEKPTFLWVSFSGPHFPFDAPAAFYDRVDMDRLGLGEFREGEFDDLDKIHAASYHGGGRIEGAGSAPDRATKHYDDGYWSDLRRNYFANVAQIDEQVGAILQAAQAQFGDNVLVIFTADHGEMLGNHRLWGKHNCAYEDVLNVPLLMRVPHRQTHRRTGAKVMLTDIMPTCLQTAGIVDGPQTDGTDLRVLVEQGGHPYVYAEGEGFAVIGDGQLKYIQVDQALGRFTELHDLAADPFEFENWIDRPSHLAGQTALQTALLDFFMDALLP